MTVTDRSAPCLVAFHAHPDDEAIFTGGTIALAVAAGWRVVLVVATSGEEGSAPSWLSEDLAASRRAETVASAHLLGIDRVEFLGYRDSGVGRRPRIRTDGPPWSPTDVPFDAVPIHRVVAQLRRILTDEQPVALTSYDRIGVYGHRDHRRVHEVAAASVVGTGCDLLEATVSRGELRRLRLELLRRGLDPEVWPPSLVDTIGSDDSGDLITVDVAAHLAQKRAAIAAHASQVIEASSFMGLPPGAFHRLLDREWFRPAHTVDGQFGRLLAGHRPPRSLRPRDAQLGGRGAPIPLIH